MANAVIGKKVPTFKLPVTGDKALGLGDFKGRKLVIYFYPKDDTPGCTTEGQGFRDHYKAFQKAGAEIVGVSRDSVASHEKFKAKYEFPFDLISDPDEKLCAMFDVMKEKNMYGRKSMGVERSTFLIDEKGVLRQEWRKVKVPGHVEAVLEAVKAL
ncbi:peroxiredoxin [Thioalkalivibrio sp. XN279]|uniref:peroxiredoxin n=1 Tax=Thioalkalivibrio sp. XN279 TaxID=2714953 RepID=UPI00140C902F|nr:peroxiredoxin [Thioalkalivibrio sp. XN279]NHA14717.1 peroxiredoxin [Thioalkalivibrio sp. XN279]